MSIRTQRIEIFSDTDPINSSFVNIPVRDGEHIMSNEPYAADLYKMYAGYCTEDTMKSISVYENANKFKSVCEGQVYNYNENKSTAEIYLSGKHSILVDVNPNEKLNCGDKIDVVVTKVKGKLFGDASSRSAQLERMRQELLKEIQSPTSAYVGAVKEIVYNSAGVFNGFIVDIKGVRCFMPGTESHVVPLNDFNELLGKELYVMPINQMKESIVVSHKEFLNTLKPGVFDELSKLEKGSIVSGEVSSVKNFGVFILIGGCVPTLLSVSEMNEITEDKFKNGLLKAGDVIDFYVDSINLDSERVIVTQTVSKSEGWEKLKEAITGVENYKLNGVVKNLYENGVVILSSEFNNITFFLSSKVVDVEKLSVGQEVVLPVENVDTTKKTVRLKIE